MLETLSLFLFQDKAAMEISPTEEPSTYSKSFWNALSFRRRDHSYSAIDNVMDKPRKVGMNELFSSFSYFCLRSLITRNYKLYLC